MPRQPLLHAITTACAVTLLSRPVLAQLPPTEDSIRRYFQDADVVAVGRVASLRVQASGQDCCRVSFSFHVARFLKGTDTPRFTYAFKPRGASKEDLQQYYGAKDFVFFYSKPGPEGVERNSLWIARATRELLKVLEQVTPSSS